MVWLVASILASGAALIGVLLTRVGRVRILQDPTAEPASLAGQGAGQPTSRTA